MLENKRLVKRVFKFSFNLNTLILLLLFSNNVNAWAKLPQQGNKDYSTVDSLNDLSRNYSFVDNVKALQYANEALELAILLDYKRGQAFAFRNMSSIYSAQLSFAESIDYVNKALNIFEQLNDLEGIANCNISLGHTFSRLDQDTAAFGYHLKAWEYFKSTEDINRKSITAHNLGQAHYMINQPDSAQVYFEIALSLLENLENDQLKSSCLSNLGMIAYESGDTAKAEIYFLESLNIFKALVAESQKFAALSSLYHLSLIHKLRNENSKKLYFLKEAVEVIQEYQVPYFVDEIYEELISHYEEFNDLANVKNYTLAYAEILKELNRNSIIDKSKIYLDLIQSKDLERMYTEKLNSNEINEKIIEANAGVIQALVIVSIVLAVFLILLIYQFLTNKKNTDAIESIYNNTKTPIILLSEEGVIIRWNEAAQRLLGETSDDFVNENFFKEFVSEDFQLKPADIEASFLNEFTIMTKKGIKKEVSINCSKSLLDREVFYVLLVLDRTEFKRLQRENDFYQVILEKSNEIAKIGTWEITYSSFKNNEMPIISSKVFEMLDFDKVDPSMLKGMSWTNFFKSKESIQGLIDVFKLAVSSQSPFDIELVLVSIKGNDVWVRLIGNIEMISKDDFKLFGTVQDITEVKRGVQLIESNLCKEQELNKLKSRFISMASHEFRTPLATITTSVELIQMNVLRIKNENCKVIDRHSLSILNQVDRLENTLDSILMLEKSIQGKVEINYNEVDLEVFVADLISNINVLGEERIPNLIVLSDNNKIISDPNLLHHILSNIISNALKYSKGEQAPEVFVKNNNEKIIIEVKDYGIGIPDSDKSGLFNSFYRAKNTTGIKGTGLGLSIVKEFATLIDAEVIIDSKEGEGTNVKIVLPLVPHPALAN